MKRKDSWIEKFSQEKSSPSRFLAIRQFGHLVTERRNKGMTMESVSLFHHVALSLFSIDNIAYRFEFLESKNILI